MVELDNMKSEIQTYQIPLQEVSASLDLENKEKRIEELEMEMQSPNFWDDPEISNKKMKESKNLKDTVDTMHGLLNQYRDILELIEMGYEENDPAIIPDIQAELDHFKSTFEEIRINTLFSEEYDHNNAILKLNAGAGGTESCDWCAMLFRMYSRWSGRGSVWKYWTPWMVMKQASNPLPSR